MILVTAVAGSKPKYRVHIFYQSMLKIFGANFSHIFVNLVNQLIQLSRFKQYGPAFSIIREKRTSKIRNLIEKKYV